MLSYSEAVVPFSDVQFDDRSYRITTENDKDDAWLEQSIEEVGLLTSPILQKSGRDTYRVVAGFRRLAVMQRLKKTEAACRLLGQAATDLDCLKIAIIDNSWQRPLNPGEQARAIHKLSLMIGNQDELCRNANRLGLPSTVTALTNLQAVYSLPEAVFDDVSAGRIAISTALFLNSLDTQTAGIMARLFVDLKLGGNKQRAAITLVEEITAAEDISFHQLLDQISDQTIIIDPDADRARRSEHFFTYLRSRRFPRLSSAEADFSKKIKGLKPGRGAKLMPPIDFEGTAYTLQLTFKDKKDLDRHIMFLKRISKSDLIPEE